MTGRRVTISPHLYEPGDYGRWAGGWYCRPPEGPHAMLGIGNISGHQITEHEDGTITVSPSILIKCGGEWHGFLEKGVWRQC